ncbi:hypothetical protein H4Q26_011360 [Puccinia striiformis f. sp. tritici PST-130]|uniref:Amino acid permease/ SLC12A domain-containing protein n=1 Tax=Puccinia striiformis f. sp. tritici PST-78 TaxID=1165861 RepID=A0A0L0W2C1_9BASI|nr:hypothetical protein H4Q26_011360 [Puccinia striiformis f. sp. tritici PST-130]KNF05688.1 hypothetical protein PSTG_01091 [Puccinia striiformis f. sp. tritici PST-78]
MRSRREAGDCEEKGHISIERTSDLDSKFVERDGQKESLSPNQGLGRGMKSRHIQMISIGGVIGTGLFLGTASALHNAGPAGMVLGYLVMGSISWVVMGCLGEMVAHLPIPGGHVTLAERFVSPSLSFTMGYNYWYSWSIILPTEMSASAVLINYWITSVNNGVWIFVALAVVISINCCGSKIYGEFEFWSVVFRYKILSRTVLIVLGIVLDLGGGPNRDFIGARHWKNPGPWVEYLGRKGPLGHFMGFLAATNQASFATLGSEIAAFAATEAKNPKKALPTAIRAIIWRLAVFYFLGTTIIGLLVPSNEPRLRLHAHAAASSPFVIAIERSGIKYLPSIINVVWISSAWSAASSNMYISSRALYSLAVQGNAPKIFRKTNSWGVPWTCTIVASCWGCLALVSVSHSGAGAVFEWLANMYSTSGFLTWIGVLVTYVRWEAGVKAQNIDRSTFPYRAPLRTAGAIYGIVVCSFLVIVNSYQVFLPNNWDSIVFFTGISSRGLTTKTEIRMTPLLEIQINPWGEKSSVGPQKLGLTLE